MSTSKHEEATGPQGLTGGDAALTTQHGQLVNVNDALGVPDGPMQRPAAMQTVPSTPSALAARGQSMEAPEELVLLREQPSPAPEAEPPVPVDPDAVQQPPALDVAHLVEESVFPPRGRVHRNVAIGAFFGAAGSAGVYALSDAGHLVAAPPLVGGLALVTCAVTGIFVNRGWSGYLEHSMGGLVKEIIDNANASLDGVRTAYNDAVSGLNRSYRKLLSTRRRTHDKEIQKKNGELETVKGQAKRRGDDEFKIVMSHSIFYHGGLVLPEGVVQRADDKASVNLADPNYALAARAYVIMRSAVNPRAPTHAFMLCNGVWIIEGRVMIAIDDEAKLVLAVERQGQGYNLDADGTERELDATFRVGDLELFISFSSKVAHAALHEMASDFFKKDGAYDDSTIVTPVSPEVFRRTFEARAAAKRRLTAVSKPTAAAA